MARSNNSTATAIELDFFLFWTPFVRTFQFFGASHHSIFCRELRTQRRKCNLLRLAFCAQILFTFTCIYFHFRMGPAISIYTIESTSSIFAYVNNVSYYCYSIPNLFFPIETFAMRRTEQRIYDTMRNIDAIFQHKLNYVIDYRMHRRRQIMKILLCFVGPTALTVYGLFVSFPLKMQQFSISSTLIFVYLNVVWRIRLAQIAMHMHALSDLLGELSGLMQRRQHKLEYTSADWRRIRFDRHIYTSIWQLRMLIGECFGMSMILFVAGSVLKVITCSYWFFLNVQSLGLLNLYIRSYFAIHCAERNCMLPSKTSFQSSSFLWHRMQGWSFIFATFQIDAWKWLVWISLAFLAFNWCSILLFLREDQLQLFYIRNKIIVCKITNAAFGYFHYKSDSSPSKYRQTACSNSATNFWIPWAWSRFYNILDWQPLPLIVITFQLIVTITMYVIILIQFQLNEGHVFEPHVHNSQP